MFTLFMYFFYNFQFYFNLAELLAPGNLPLPLGLKPGSHMPPVPPELFFIRMRTFAAGNWSYPRALILLVHLRVWTRVNFAGMLAVRTGITNVAGHFCSHIRTVSQAVPAAMSQVHRWHLRTRLTFLHQTHMHIAYSCMLSTLDFMNLEFC